MRNFFVQSVLDIILDYNLLGATKKSQNKAWPLKSTFPATLEKITKLSNSKGLFFFLKLRNGKGTGKKIEIC